MKQILVGLAIVFGVLGFGIALAYRSLNAPRATSAPGASRSTEAIATISHGDRVRIDDHLGSGLTVVEFYADW